MRADSAIPRLLSKIEAARYLGYGTTESLQNLIDRGVIPPPIPGTARFDRLAIDAALDRVSGLRGRSQLVPNTPEMS
jgi:hypothetical protein